MNCIRIITLTSLLILFGSVAFADSWSVYTDINDVLDLEPDGDYIWAGTSGGLVRWDTRDRTYTAWTIADGLPHNFVQSIARRPDGTFWLSTRGGFCLFDPSDGSVSLLDFDYTASRFNPPRLDGDPDGGFWYIANYDRTLGHYRDGVHTTYAPADFNDAAENFDQVTLDHTGAVWVVTDSLVHVRNDDTWRTLDIKRQLHYDKTTLHVFFTADGIPYVLTSKEAGWLEDGTYHYLTDKPDWGYYISTARSLDDIWMSVLSSTVFHFNGEEWTSGRLDVEFGCTEFVDDIVLTDSGEIIAGTRSGIFVMGENAEEVTSRYCADDALFNNYICSVEYLEDRNMLWVTHGEGLSWFDGRRWRYEEVKGIGYGDTVQDSDGTLWHIDPPRGSQYNRDGVWRNAMDLPGWDQARIRIGLKSADAGDDLWFACTDTLFRYSDGEIRAWSTEEIQDGGTIYAVKADTGGTAWVNGDMQLSYWDGTRWRSWLAPTNTSGYLFDMIEPVGNGTVWLRTSRVLLRFDLETERFSWHILDWETAGHAEAVACDGNGRVWTSINGGIATIDDGEWRFIGFFDRAPGDFDVFVFSMDFDTDGNLWIGTDNGVYRYTPDPVTTAVDDEPTPSAIALTASPNPFNPATTIGFTIPADGPATLAVYNLAGQRVRTLADGPMSAGGHTIVWDGTDDAGRAVAAGVYLTRLTAGRMTATGKMALIK